MSDLVGSIVITCEWPDIQIVEVAGQLPSFVISAPHAPLIEFTSVGIRGADGSGAALYEASFVDANPWIVNHNFGRKPTSVQVLTVGAVEILAEVVHISDNQLRVLFVEPYTGSVRVM
jgi:hypothetical protein